VSNVKSARNPSASQPWSEIAPYAILSLGSFLCGLVIIALLLWKADKLVALGLVGNLYYIALLPLGLSAAAFLFGALRSSSRLIRHKSNSWKKVVLPTH